MALKDKKWVRISLHHVVLEWLRSERHNESVNGALIRHARWVDRLIDYPDLSDPDQNRARLRLLYLIRLPVVSELPPDITWYRVGGMTDDELVELHVIHAAGWIRARGESALRDVAAWKKIPLVKPPSQWHAPILFGHGKSGPFTILEDNHRLTAYAGKGETGIDISVLVGVSSLGCHWHAPSAKHRGVLLRDLIWPEPKVRAKTTS